MKKRIAFKTLGCRLNQYETDALVSQFYDAGYEIVDFGEQADITIINTCTVTNQSDHKSRNYISKSSRINPEGLTVVAGCMVDNHKEDLSKQKNISFLIENEKKSSIFPMVESFFHGEKMDHELFDNDVFNYETVNKSLHTRTSIKIQDGCDNFCTFCIIPSVRGIARSRPVKDILDNIQRVTDNGFKEIVITGVNIGRYDYDGYNFQKLLEKILTIQGDFRIRISSLEPDGFGEDLYEVFQDPRMNPHLHLCLQSGSDNILMKMRRMYNVRSFMQIIERFRKNIPDFNFTTDIIVGFPGETEEDFQQTLMVAEEAEFSHIHTFRYSVRNGTRAARMPEQIPEKIKAERSSRIRTLSMKNEELYYRKMLGKTQRLLVEKISEDGLAKGYGENYIPLLVHSANLKKNDFIDVRLDKILPGAGLEVKASPLN